MLFQVEALRQVDAFLKAHDIPYVVIGGIANAVRGEPRATHDADLKVLVQGMTIADRPKDWLDIEKILLRQGSELDIEYVRSWLTQFADALEKPAILVQFNQLLTEEQAGQA
jgi:hypothetical protein